MDAPADVYRSRHERFSAVVAESSRRFDRTANLRLLTFGAAAACAGVAIWRSLAPAALAALLFLAVFVALVRYHAGLARRRQRADILARINDEALQRLARDWERLPLRHPVKAGAGHAYAADLDVLGPASLFHLLDTTTSPMGAEALTGWLLAASAPPVVRERQAAVAELGALVDLREELQLRGRLLAQQAPDPGPLLAWAEGEPWLAGRRALLWWARTSPVLLATSFAAWLLHLIAAPLWALLIPVNLVVWLLAGGGGQRVLGTIRVHHQALGAYADQLALVAGMEPSAPLLRRLRNAVTVGGRPAHRLLHRLDTLAGLALTQGSDPLVHAAAQGLLLWNVHVLDALERWQRAAGPQARGWLDRLGELEALAALAGLAHANPSWTFPTLEPGARALTARRAGHPLIQPDRRVDNDVTLGPPGTFLLVTGSNMSGKSTLLRTLGLNAVLAGAGGPACAGEMRLPPVHVWTSMRVRDSLQDGVSYFLAEVQRLKQVVDAARQAAGGGPLVCYLLDEVLQGTNTAERRVAARGIVSLLVSLPAIGAVATHDLTLADAPDVAPAARPVHFRETVSVEDGHAAMSFDYRARPGLATSTNALRLLEAMGLMLPRAPGAPPVPPAAPAGQVGQAT
ncbi:MAG TPA: DNA mismatch repair protein MutS [Candidatus Dormibacteraeota bacterium]|nr:DNA mismatch repair protein MutS [Candidatus Dormibacteraeota bacterium]